jgi:hypothetical protein
MHATRQISGRDLVMTTLVRAVLLGTKHRRTAQNKSSF